MASPTLSTTVFTKDNCPNCVQLKSWLRRQRIPYREINVQQDFTTYGELDGLTPLDYVTEVLKYREMPVVNVHDSEGLGLGFSGIRYDQMQQLKRLVSSRGELIAEEEPDLDPELTPESMTRIISSLVSGTLGEQDPDFGVITYQGAAIEVKESAKGLSAETSLAVHDTEGRPSARIQLEIKASVTPY